MEPRELYDSLHANEIFRGTYEEFKERYASSDAKIQLLHAKLAGAGAYTKGFDEFKQRYFAVTEPVQDVKKKAAPLPPYMASSSGSKVSSSIRHNDQVFNWKTGKVNLPSKVEAPPIQSPSDLGSETTSPNPFTEAYTRLEEKRKGDFDTPAIELAGVKQSIADARASGMTPLEKQTLDMEKQTLAEAGVKDNPFAPFAERGTKAEFNAMLNAISSDNRDISLAIEKSRQEIIAGGDPAVVGARIAKLQGLYERNMQALESEVKSGKYKTVEDLQQYFQQRQQERDEEERRDGLAASALKTTGRVILHSSAKALAAVANLTDMAEKAVGAEGDKPGAMDIVQNYAVNLADDVQSAFPAPTNLSRGIYTETAKWGDKQVDFADNGRIAAVRDKDGFVIDTPLSEEEQKQVMSLPRSTQLNRVSIPAQVAATVSDVLVQVALAKGIGSIRALPAITASRMGATVGMTELGTTAGMVAANTAMMSGDLYDEAVKAGASKESAARYALGVGAAIGLLDANIGLGIEAKLMGKGFKLPAVNPSGPLKKLAESRIASIVTGATGEAVQESVVENIVRSGAQAVMNESAGTDFDLSQNFEKKSMATDATLGFITGGLLSIAHGRPHDNDIMKSVLVEASGDIEGSISSVRSFAEENGMEFTPEMEERLRDELTVTAQAVERIPPEHVGKPEVVAPMVEKTRIDCEVEALKEEMKGKDASLVQDKAAELEQKELASAQKSIEVSKAAGLPVDEKAAKKVYPDGPPPTQPPTYEPAGELQEGETYYDAEMDREYTYTGESDGMLRFRKVARPGEVLMAEELEAFPDSMFSKRLKKKVQDAKQTPSFSNEGLFDPIDESSKRPGSRIFSPPAPVAEELHSELTGGDVGAPITKLNKDRSRAIAEEYEKMPDTPDDPETVAAYEAMAEETLQQFDAISSRGVNVEVYDGEGEPYSNSEEALNDLRDNNHLYVLSTEKEFGNEPITEEMRAKNPLLRDSGKKDINGRPLLVNDVFRFVHDFFGHGARGNGFGPVGEENAWDVHARMYSPLARRAMTTETRGQNSWVNFLGQNDAARAAQKEARKLRAEGKEEEADRLLAENPFKFAPQKTGLMPEWVSEPYPSTPSKEETGSGIVPASPVLDTDRNLPPPDTIDPPTAPTEEPKKKRGFYENSLPKMEGQTPGRAVLASIAEVNPQFYGKMSIRGEAEAIANEIDANGLEATALLAVSPPEGEAPQKTMARRVVVLIAIGDAIASANDNGDTATVDRMSSVADTLERLIGRAGTDAGQSAAMIAYYSMTPRGIVARFVRKASRKREEIRGTNNESGKKVGEVVDAIASEAASIDVTEEVVESVKKAVVKAESGRSSRKATEAAKKQLEEARRKLRAATTGSLSSGLNPAVVSALVDVFKAHVRVVGTRLNAVRKKYLEDAKSFGISEKDALSAVADEIAALSSAQDSLTKEVERASLGLQEGLDVPGLADRLQAVGLEAGEALDMAAEISANFKKLVESRTRQRLAAIAKKHEVSERKARAIENAMVEAVMLGGLDEDNIRQAVEEKYGIRAFTSAEISELNNMAADARSLPGDRLKQRKMVEILDYIAVRNGEDAVEVIHSLWYAAVLSDVKTWLTVGVGNVANFFNQYLMYGMMTDAGRFAMKESASRLFDPGSRSGIWFGLNEAIGFIVRGDGFKAQNKLVKSSSLERISRASYTGLLKRAGSNVAKVARYTGRIMSAADAIMFYAAYDFNLERLAYKAAQAEGLDGAQAAGRAREIVGRSKAAMAQKYSDAKRELEEYASSKGKGFGELFTELDISYRVREKSLEALDAALPEEAKVRGVVSARMQHLADQKGVPLDLADVEAEVRDIMSSSGGSRRVQELAEEVALQGVPKGIFGILAKAIGGNFPQVFDTENTRVTGNRFLDNVTKGAATALRVYSGFMFPFMKTAANMINMAVDYAPVLGILQKVFVEPSLRAVTQGKVDQTLDWSNIDDRNVFIARQFTGTVLMLMLGAAFAGDDDDFYITAEGPKDFNKKSQLYSMGWKPWTIRVGKNSYYYRDSPLAIVLGYLGAQHDHRKWNSKDGEEMTFGSSVMAALMAYLTNAPFLQTLNDLTGALQSNDSSKLAIALTRPVTGFTNPGMARMVDRWVSPELRDSRTVEDRWLGSVLGSTAIASNMLLDVKRNAIGDIIDPYEHMSTFSRIIGADRYVSPGTPSSDVFEVMVQKDLFFPEINAAAAKHFDGTPLTFEEQRDFLLAVSLYRGLRHKPNVQKMREMPAEVLEKKIREVDSEAKLVARAVLFQRRGQEISPEEMEEIMKSPPTVGQAKRMAKEMKDADIEKISIPKKLDY